MVRTLHPSWCVAAALGALSLTLIPARADGPVVKVRVEQEKEETFEAGGPVDPTPRLQLRQVGQTFAMYITQENGQRLHLSHYPTIKIDGTVFMPVGKGAIAGGTFEVVKEGLPKKGGKDRIGYMKVWTKDDIRITQTAELTPSKTLIDGKRRLDAVLVRYTIENKGSVPHSVGLRTAIDPMLGNQRNCKFAAPNQPNKILQGVELKDREIPAYVQALQNADLRNPGQVAHVTFALGGGFERPERVVLTSMQGKRDLWDLPVIANGFSSLVGFFWEPKDLRPGGKRELAYAFGSSLAAPVGADANFQVQFAGSFEKGKLFTIAATIADPADGQSLELELPKGLERVQGKQIQPVPPGEEAIPYSRVEWKCRVLEYGEHPIRIRSSAGVSKTAKLTIGPG
jgi:hypothetical protein